MSQVSGQHHSLPGWRTRALGGAGAEIPARWAPVHSGVCVCLAAQQPCVHLGKPTCHCFPVHLRGQSTLNKEVGLWANRTLPWELKVQRRTWMEPCHPRQFRGDPQESQTPPHIHLPATQCPDLCFKQPASILPETEHLGQWPSLQCLFCLLMGQRGLLEAGAWGWAVGHEGTCRWAVGPVLTQEWWGRGYESTDQERRDLKRREAGP